MKVLWQIGLIISVCFLGEGISLLLPVAFPGSVIAMLLLFFLLLSGWIRPRQLQHTADFLLQNMSALFVPLGVGLMQVFDDLRDSLLPFMVVCILSTILTFVVTALTVRGVIRLQQRVRKGKGERS